MEASQPSVEPSIELEQANSILNETGRQNLLLLRDKMPKLYELYRQYQPKKFKLCIDSQNAINLIDDNQALVYPPNPQPEVLKQVALYKQNAKVFIYKPKVAGATHQPLPRHQFVHAHHMNDIWKMRYDNSQAPTLKGTLPSVVPMMVIVGIGLGYHLEELVSTENIRNMFVYEPDMDIFYAFLHVINLRPIFDKIVKNHGTITFQVGSSSGAFLNGLSDFMWQRGHFNSARLYYYCHYNSEAAHKATEQTNQLINRMMQCWGFFEDELVGIAHSLQNIEKRLPYIKNKASMEPLPQKVPAVIIGSGPSIDGSLETIKQLQNNCVIFSCGSSLGTLHKNGITPDFHIEIERTSSVDDWFALMEDDAYFNNISMISLNTIHPKIESRFKHNIKTLKANDMGAELIWEALQSDPSSSETALKAVHCNPTVINGGVAFSIGLGFSTLYLFGVDLGFKDLEHHHSKDTQYFNPKNPASAAKALGDRSYPGNFCESVLSNDLFDYSRFEVERALQENPDVTCFNCSDGIRITHTTPLHADEINIDASAADKSNTLSTIKHQHLIYPDEHIPKKALQAYQQKSVKIHELMTAFIDLLDRPITTIEDALDIFSDQRALLQVLRERKDILYTMCSGTLNYFQTMITSYALEYQNPSDAIVFLEQALPYFQYHLKCMLYLEKQAYNKSHIDYCAMDLIENMEHAGHV